VLTLAALVLLATPDVQAAGDDPGALLQRGTELRRAGRDEEALELFERADRLQPSPRAHAQVGLAEQALGRWVAAERDISQAMAAGGDAWIEKNRTTLETALAAVRGHLGRLAVLGVPANAVVSINGAPVGRLPLSKPVTVAAGDVVATVEAPGYVSISRKVNVPAGELVRETIDLPVDPLASARPPASPPPLPPSAVLAVAPVAAAPSLVVPAGSAAPATHSGRSTAAWIAGGLGFAALVVGTVADLRYVDKVNSFNAESGCDAAAPNRGTATGCQGLYDSFTEMKPLAIGSFISAAVLGGAAAWLFWSGHRDLATHDVACATTLRGGGCGITF
jgi:hypothetical protein